MIQSGSKNTVRDQRLLLLILLVLWSGCGVSYGTIRETRLPFGDGFVNYYLLPGDGAESERELVIFLAGSIVGSALGEKGTGGWTHVTLAYFLREGLPKTTDLIVPEYANVELGAPMPSKEDQAVWAQYSLEARVSSVTTVINHALEHHHYNIVSIVGYSEGALIGAKVYRLLRTGDQVDGLVLISYGGMSQYDGFRILYENFRGERNPFIAQLADLDATIAEIDQQAVAIDRWWLGYPYRRWSTFGPYRPIDDLLAVDIPVLMLHGDQDRQAPVESSRMADSAFREAGKSNLTYREYTGCDHAFNEEFESLVADIVGWLGRGYAQMSGKVAISKAEAAGTPSE